MPIDPDVQPYLDAIDDRLTKQAAQIAALQVTPPSTNGSRNPVLVAASNAPSSVKATATYVCDGTDDHAEINNAIAVAAGGVGEVHLSGGLFRLAAPIVMRTGVWLHGVGVLTEITGKVTLPAGYGTEPAFITNAGAGDHLMRVSDLWLNGNYSGGGTAHGIGFRCSGGAGQRGGRPDSNPDPDITIHDLYISKFTGGTRHGILMDTDCRGSIIDRVQIRDCTGDGIWMKDSPDSHLSNIHIGGATKCGFRTTGGNVKFTNCKAYYCDDAGFSIQSGRGALAACESQDNVNGFRFAADCVASALVADTFRDTGFIVAADRVQILGAAAFNRGGARFATSGVGFALNGRSKLAVVGSTNKVTTPVQGTGGGFVRIDSYTVG
jgi:hypothetical protein